MIHYVNFIKFVCNLSKWWKLLSFKLIEACRNFTKFSHFILIFHIALRFQFTSFRRKYHHFLLLEMMAHHHISKTERRNVVSVVFCVCRRGWVRRMKNYEKKWENIQNFILLEKKSHQQIRGFFESQQKSLQRRESFLINNEYFFYSTLAYISVCFWAFKLYFTGRNLSTHKKKFLWEDTKRSLDVTEQSLDRDMREIELKKYIFSFLFTRILSLSSASHQKTSHFYFEFLFFTIAQTQQSSWMKLSWEHNMNMREREFEFEWKKGQHRAERWNVCGWQWES